MWARRFGGKIILSGATAASALGGCRTVNAGFYAHSGAQFGTAILLVPSCPFFCLDCSSLWLYMGILTEVSTAFSALNLDMKSNALLSALPYFVMWILCLILSSIADLLIRHHITSSSCSRLPPSQLKVGVHTIIQTTIYARVTDVATLNMPLNFSKTNTKATCHYIFQHHQCSRITDSELRAAPNTTAIKSPGTPPPTVIKPAITFGIELIQQEAGKTTHSYKSYCAYTEYTRLITALSSTMPPRAAFTIFLNESLPACGSDILCNSDKVSSKLLSKEQLAQLMGGTAKVNRYGFARRGGFAFVEMDDLEGYQRGFSLQNTERISDVALKSNFQKAKKNRRMKRIFKRKNNSASSDPNLTKPKPMLFSKLTQPKQVNRAQAALLSKLTEPKQCLTKDLSK
uniref:Uncharacterized protein n=1 Tax=Glossina pallidipes TaxID=7398 RepID=A0A1A9ZP76_GLOPL